MPPVGAAQKPHQETLDHGKEQNRPHARARHCVRRYRSPAAPALNAADNPFKLDSLKNGYQVADNDKAKEGKCGGDKAKEGKCGGTRRRDGKCGGDKAKEGKCGGDKAKRATRPRKAPAAATSRQASHRPARESRSAFTVPASAFVASCFPR